MNDNPTPDHGRAAKIDLARFRSARRGHEPSIDHDQADRIIQTIKTAADTLNAQTDLSPANPKITEVLSRLVKAVTEPTNPATAMHVLGNREIRTVQKQLWENLSRAEGEMEAWWTTQFLRERKLDLNTLEQFWYRDNYKELTQLEVDHWAQQNKRPDADSHVVFVGSGPLPLTAIDLHLQTGAKITCIDIDPQAVKQSQMLLRKLGLDRHIEVVQATGEEADFKDVTHAMVAALVPNQKAVVERVLEQSPTASIGVRSAQGLRSILYPPSDDQGLKELGLIATGGSQTNDRVINTLLTFIPGPRLDLTQDPHEKRAAGHDCAACTNMACQRRLGGV